MHWVYQTTASVGTPQQSGYLDQNTAVHGSGSKEMQSGGKTVVMDSAGNNSPRAYYAGSLCG